MRHLIVLLALPLFIGATTQPSSSPPDFAAVRAAGEKLCPTATNPTSIAKDDKASRGSWKSVIDRYTSLPADEVTAHPTADDFPGAIPKDTARITRELSFPLNLPRWQSTGLYAAPGEKVTITISPDDVPRKLAVVIGCHTDDITSLTKWPRFPRITRRFVITSKQTIVANAFGGLIYIDVPRDPRLGGEHLPTFGGYAWLREQPENVPGEVKVTISGAVDAPLYQLGKTTPQAWAAMRTSAAPWGELAGRHIILTLRTEAIARLDDPAPVLQYWDKVIETEAELAGKGIGGHPAIKDLHKLMTDRLADPPKIDPWTNLVIYIRTIEAFGWEPLQQTLKSYSDPRGSDGIRTRQDKIDQWVLRYSKACGRNLADYYSRFDLKCLPGIAEQIKDLPLWLPDEIVGGKN